MVVFRYYLMISKFVKIHLLYYEIVKNLKAFSPEF